KRLAQYARWTDEVIPRLIGPYMKYVRESSNLAEELSVEAEECVCLTKGLGLEVLVVRFNKLEKITIRTCACQTAATQLMKRGLFGCAPLRPSLAVDLRVLDFVSRLFLRISPNNTAVCNTIEDFLKCQGYQLRGQDPLRRRFANALQWYNNLQQSTNEFVDSVLQRSRQAI
ncbi:hypothetical protein BT96DRAFT_747706, partial [Gymnopus androsaceus JB14]